MAGVDESGPHLYETDPSGAMMAYKAGGIGAGRNEVMEVFEDNYKEGMTQAQAIALGLKALAAANEHKLKSETIEIAVVSAKEDFHTLDQADVKKAVAKAK
jgi:proteasome alpha subunit